MNNDLSEPPPRIQRLLTVILQLIERFPIDLSSRQTVLHMLENHHLNQYFPLYFLKNFLSCNKQRIETEISRVATYDSVVHFSNYCGCCMVIFTAPEHLSCSEHLDSMSTQPCRLNAFSDRHSCYQRWIAGHGIARDHIVTKSLSVRITLKRNKDRHCTIYAAHKRLEDHFMSIPMINADSEIGKRSIKLLYKISGTHDTPITVYKAMVTDNGCHSPEKILEIPSVSGETLVEVEATLECTTPGLKFYTLQVWLQAHKENGESVIFPTCCEIRWEWYVCAWTNAISRWLDKGKRKKIRTKQDTINERHDSDVRPLSKIPDLCDIPRRATDVPKAKAMNKVSSNRGDTINERHDSDVRPLSKIPDLCDIPRRATDVPKAKAMNKVSSNRGDYYDPCFAPHIAAWDQVPDKVMSAKLQMANKRLFSSGDDAENNADVLDLNIILDKETRVTKDNIATRCLLEVIGEAQHDEDNQPKAAINGMKFLERTDATRFASAKKVLRDLQFVYLVIDVLSAELDYLKLPAFNGIRLVHHNWQYKYPGSIVEKHYNGRSTTLLVQFTNEAGAIINGFLQLGCDFSNSNNKPFLICAANFVTSQLLKLYKAITEPNNNDVPLLNERLSRSKGRKRQTDHSTKVVEKQKRFDMALKQKFHKCINHLFCCSSELKNEISKRDLPDELIQKCKLDKYQRQILRSLLSGNFLTSCVAPPGTGKTYLVAMCVVLWHMAFPTDRILCVAPTNAAANVLAEKIKMHFEEINGRVPPWSLIRYVRKDYPQSELGDGLYKHSNLYQKYSTTEKIHRHKIIVATVDLAIINIISSIEVMNNANESYFRLLAIDEAACVHLPRMFILLTVTTTSQTVMVGDPNQLPAYIASNKVRCIAGDESGMEFITRVMERREIGEIIYLQNNYRSLQSIIEPSNRVLYHDYPLAAVNNIDLKRQVMNLNSGNNERLLKKIFPGNQFSGVSFVHVEAPKTRRQSSCFNGAELFAVYKLINVMCELGISQSDIGVDTTYEAQTSLAVELINKNPHAPFPDVKIGCANVWQGNERDFMIISLVRSTEGLVTYGYPAAAGFLDDYRRLNVSLTRARKGHVVVGNALRFVYHPLVAEILRDCCINDSWVNDDLAGDGQPSPHLFQIPTAVKQFVHLTVCESLPLIDGQPREDLQSIEEWICDPEFSDCRTHPK